MKWIVASTTSGVRWVSATRSRADGGGRGCDGPAGAVRAISTGGGRRSWNAPSASAARMEAAGFIYRILKGEIQRDSGS